MVYAKKDIAVLLLGLATLASAKPIMVSFGTNQGPIVPREKSIPLTSRTIVARSPAPVSEQTEDIPNPNTYRPMVPHQYRDKLYSYRPSPNLILGTPIDQKYTPGIDKYNIYKKQGRSLGVDYTGPHIFEKQEYELYEERKPKPAFRPAVNYIKPQYYQHGGTSQNPAKYVPQIGIVYSAGVRYYVPQISYYNGPKYDYDEQENSVYDQQDEKHFYRAKPQQ